MSLQSVSTSFPDSTYSSTNKPSADTLKSDIQAIETAVNDHATNAADLASSQTLSNKVFTKPTVNGSVQGSSSYTPSAGGTATLDLSTANRHVITMPAGNITIALSNVTVGQMFIIEIIQDSVGSRTVTWFTTIKWPGGSAPTLTTTANKKDSIAFVCTSSGNYDAYPQGFNL